MNKNKILTAIWGIITIAILAFILTNSMRNGEESMNQSSFFVSLFESIFDPTGKLTSDEATYIVRKAAHFTEFFFLGLSMTMFLYHLGKEIKRSSYVLPFFVCLLSATTDEFIQNFTGRTSSVIDVMIDFLGSSIAITATMLIIFLIKRSQTKKCQNA